MDSFPVPGGKLTPRQAAIYDVLEKEYRPGGPTDMDACLDACAWRVLRGEGECEGEAVNADPIDYKDARLEALAKASIFLDGKILSGEPAEPHRIRGILHDIHMYMKCIFDGPGEDGNARNACATLVLHGSNPEIDPSIAVESELVYMSPIKGPKLDRTAADMRKETGQAGKREATVIVVGIPKPVPVPFFVPVPVAA